MRLPEVPQWTAAILDVLKVLKIIQSPLFDEGKQLLHRTFYVNQTAADLTDRSRARARLTETYTFLLSDRQSLLGSHQQSWWFNELINVDYVQAAQKSLFV